nr:kinesin 3 [Hymenolepis microstoma]
MEMTDECRSSRLLEDIPRKCLPTDFISSQDWSSYIEICRHLQCSPDVLQAESGSKERNCLIRFIYAFNRLYTQYSLLFDALENAHENQEVVAQTNCGHISRGEDRCRGDYKQRDRSCRRLSSNDSSIEGSSVSPEGGCMQSKKGRSKISRYSGDAFDYIELQPSASSIWVNKVQVRTKRAVLLSKGLHSIEGERLPIAFEIALPKIQRKIQKIMAVCPYLVDPLEIAAELRAVNYDTNKCIKYFDKTKPIREQMHEFLASQSLRPSCFLGMTEEEFEEFLFQYKERLEIIRKFQKDAERRIQRLQTFSGGLVEVINQVLTERDNQRKSIEGTTEYYRNLNHQLSSLTEENIQLREILKKQEELRKILFNMIQEYLGNIRVFCRVRAIPHSQSMLAIKSNDTVTLNSDTTAEEYKFDRVFSEDANQAEIYGELVPLICSFMDGFNVCFITYGGESSGKTHTLMGSTDEIPENRGVVYRALRTVLQEKATRRTEWDITLKVGVVEIYNENFIDLIGGETGISIRVDSGVDKMIDSIQNIDLESESQIDEILKMCSRRRKVAKTALNDASSRSHLILLVRVHSVSNVYQKILTSVLAMCDLAGFENIIKADTMGDRVLVKEAGFINRSLTALNRVLTSLRTQNPKAVSFRDRKCILIVTVRTDKASLASTQGTLRFGRDTRTVSLGRARKQISMEKLIQDISSI